MTEYEEGHLAVKDEARDIVDDLFSDSSDEEEPTFVVGMLEDHSGRRGMGSEKVTASEEPKLKVRRHQIHKKQETEDVGFAQEDSLLNALDSTRKQRNAIPERKKRRASGLPTEPKVVVQKQGKTEVREQPKIVDNHAQHEESDEKPRRKKKKKKRSKMKNIRKDKRNKDHKPGGTQYKGEVNYRERQEPPKALSIEEKLAKQEKHYRKLKQSSKHGVKNLVDGIHVFDEKKAAGKKKIKFANFANFARKKKSGGILDAL
ncbi:hypothetical protein PCE1_000820 [Barthelona sp. PCE]